MAVLPLLNISIPGILPTPTYMPGTLALLSLCMVFAALALSYNLLLGSAGMLSFGHALYFGAGAYGLGIALEHFGVPLWPGIFIALIGGMVIAFATGAVAMRVSGIPFAMVTLAFAQAGSVLVRRNSEITGGEEGLGLNTEHVPDFLVGVINTRNLYWFTLVVLVIVYLVVLWVDTSRLGHLARATRENEQRVRVLGLRPYRAKLIVFVIAAVLASLAGVAYMLLQSGTVPRAVSADLTITILVMVVLGGVGFRWGAIVGGVLYTLLDQRLTVAGRIRCRRGSSRRAAHPAVGAAVPAGRAVHPRRDVPAGRHRRHDRRVVAPTQGREGAAVAAQHRRRGCRGRRTGRGARMSWEAGLEDGSHTVGRWLTDRAARSPRRIAIDDRGVTIDYATLAPRATELSEGLRAGGYGPGHRLATISGNSSDHVVAFFACALAGIAFVPLSWRLTRRASSPTCCAAPTPRSCSSTTSTDRSPTRLCGGLDRRAADRGARLDRGRGIRSALLANPRPVRHVLDDDPLLVIFTSGSEAAPKGVVLTHANCFWNNLALAQALPLTHDDVVLAMLPQFHVAGWNCQPLLAWWVGATVVLERSFQPARALQLIRERRVTAMMGVPTQYAMLAADRDWRATDVSSLRLALVGGATMPGALQAQWSTRGVPLTQGYGLTEAAPNVLHLAPEDAEAHVGAVGTAVPARQRACRRPGHTAAARG